MATPMSRLSQILGRPKHRHHAANSSGLAEIFRPFVGFCLFFVGKLSFALPPFVWFGFTSKLFSLYLAGSILFLSPLGLHFFMAYQEFAFFSCCTFYRTSVDRVLETANVQCSCCSALFFQICHGTEYVEQGNHQRLVDLFPFSFCCCRLVSISRLLQTKTPICPVFTHKCCAISSQQPYFQLLFL